MLYMWLPMNGNLEQQGCSNVIADNVNAVIDNNGKIGKCYSFNGTNQYINLQNINLNGWPELSICCWCYPTADFSDIFLTRGGGAHRFKINANGFVFRDTNNSTLRTVALGQTIPINTWTHIICTYNRGEIYIYCNGIQTNHSTTYYHDNSTLSLDLNEYRIARAQTSSGSTYYSGKLNDFRIYNHALSVAEVREISQGLVLHYKLDNNGHRNLFTSDADRGMTIASGNTSTYTAYTYIDPIIKDNNIFKEGTQYTITYDYVINSITSSTSVYVYSQLNAARCSPLIAQTWMRNGATGSGHVVETFTVTEEQANYSSTFRVRWRINGGTEGDSITLKNVRLYLGTAEEINYISDSSGYNHNGTINGTLTLSNDTPRYSISTQFPSTAYIKITSPSTEIKTVSLWAKWNSIPSGQSIIYVDQKSKTGLGLASNGIIINANQTGKTFNKSALVANTWYHFVIISPNGSSNATRKLYINGVEQTALSSTNSWSYTIDELQLGKRSTSSDGFNGKISDFRMYCTALDADAIRQLYEVGAKIDNKNNVHSFELNEDGKNEITKTGQLKCSTFTEFESMSYLKYDPNLYIEPDGSCWVRVYHHNNPGAGSFSSTNDFEHSVYIDENRWFNVELCNYLDKWELMVKGKFTSTSSEWKLRWIQNVNPMTAVYADVAVANITKITTDGYSSSPSSWGGIYAKKGSAYLTANNGNSGNWWGAVGSYSVYQSGIPGWGPTATVTTTGFNDLYIRIDNVTFISPIVKSTKNNIWTGNEIIEL